MKWTTAISQVLLAYLKNLSDTNATKKKSFIIQKIQKACSNTLQHVLLKQ